MFLIREGIKLAERLDLDLNIGVLSGGRKSDVGRHMEVDKTIEEAEKIVQLVKTQGFSKIKNYHILVEDAIEDDSNLLIAPNGITGNLMFRTLAYLGNGRGYGAPLMGIEKTFIDTSRAGGADDYLVALKMAGALTTLP
jgi:predicted methyltransferase MtxX (methanogen marker protein 4)